MTLPPVDEALLADAIEIAEAAAALTLQWFQRAELAIDTKADGSEVTEADHAAEAYVRREVMARYPADTVIGEEGGTTAGSSGQVWVVDPIDGTASFVRGVPLYATLLAVFDQDGPAVGVVIVPALDERVSAGRGRGCLHNSKACHVSKVAPVAQSCVSSSSFDGSWWPPLALQAVTGSGAKTRTWGDGYGYLLVATGAIEAMVEPNLNRWDIAPMLTVIPEAGGTITTWSGETGLRQGEGWIASNGHIHSELAALVTT